MKANKLGIPILFCLLLIGGPGDALAQTLDIASGGAPTITGALGGSVTGGTGTSSDLSVIVNFGEISPVNTSSVVRVSVPVAVRSTVPYQINASVTGAGNANPQALQHTDIGFGLNNMRAMGAQSQVCSNSPHVIYPPFNNDPGANLTTNSAGRTVYTSSVRDLLTSTVIMSGPRLSRNSNNNRQGNDGYIFDVIFAVTPQFYAPSPTSMLITLTISAGPNVPC